MAGIETQGQDDADRMEIPRGNMSITEHWMDIILFAGWTFVLMFVIWAMFQVAAMLVEFGFSRTMEIMEEIVG